MFRARTTERAGLASAQRFKAWLFRWYDTELNYYNIRLSIHLQKKSARRPAISHSEFRAADSPPPTLLCP